mmetsp:Transcript_27378/g.42763  ORF Transcript_27378/g.42763 Transcript_27378/m.42763 type:complete len:321 (+) Transcript_27378:1-963(+)
MCGWLRHERYAKIFLGMDYILTGLLGLVAGLSSPVPEVQWQSWLFFCSFFGVGCVISVYDRWLIYLNSAVGVWMMYQGLFETDWLFGYGVMLFSTNMCFFAIHYNVIRKTNLLVQPDYEAFQLLWAEILSQDDERQAIDKLCDITQRVTDEEQSDIPARQFQAVNVVRENWNATSLDLVFSRTGSEQDKISVYGSGGGEEESLFGRLSAYPGAPVRSLEQLYTQAVLLDPILVRKVHDWASLTKGCFPVLQESASSGKTCLQWSVITQNPKLAGRVAFAKVKKPSRAIEKALRSYEGDTSKLLDLARQTIALRTDGRTQG